MVCCQIVIAFCVYDQLLLLKDEWQYLIFCQYLFRIMKNVASYRRKKGLAEKALYIFNSLRQNTKVLPIYGHDSFICKITKPHTVGSCTDQGGSVFVFLHGVCLQLLCL